MNATHADTWLFDLGNTRLKAARCVGGAPQDVVALAWELPDWRAALVAHLRAWPQPTRVLVAAVASEARGAALDEVLSEVAGTRGEFIRSPREACGVRNRYAIPQRLGIDRFLALVALRETHGAGVIVGCGTALTLDALAADGTHSAGLIALSPVRALAALQGATSIAAGNPDAFADAPSLDDTALALREGCWASAGALVAWFHARQSVDAPLYLHGGWAPELAAWLAREGHAVQMLDDAVLRGLAVWAAGCP